RERALSRLAADAQLHLDASVAQPLDPLAGCARVRVLERDDHTGRLGRDEQIGAGWSARTFVGARLQRDIDGCAARPLARLIERDLLGMRLRGCGGRVYAYDLHALRRSFLPDDGLRRSCA